MDLEFSEEFAALYKKFTSPQCDRKSFIQNYLSANGVESSVLSIAGRQHIHVVFPTSAYSPLFRMKTIIAHYDRAGDSPGANDNSSSVMSIMNFALRLSQKKTFHNVRIFFTDGEELSEYIKDDGGELYEIEQERKSVKNNPMLLGKMGAFGLAALFKKLNIMNDDVYVFDCTGRGNLPVLGQTDLPPKVSAVFAKKFKELE